MRSIQTLLAAGLVLALSACSSLTPEAGSNVSARGASPRLDEALGFPPVRGPLVFPEGTSEVTLAWLVDELARLAGVELVYGEDQRTMLERETERLDQTEPVPADEVYPFVEAMLISRGFLLELVKPGTPTMLRLYAPSPGMRSNGPGAVVVQDGDLAALERHPALVVQYAMTFRSIDSRQLQTQLRQLLVDPTGSMQVVPAGDRSLLLQGPGYRITALVQLLREVDALSGPPPVRPEAEAR